MKKFYIDPKGYYDDVSRLIYEEHSKDDCSLVEVLDSHGNNVLNKYKDANANPTILLALETTYKGKSFERVYID